MYQRRSSMVRHFQNPQLFHQEWFIVFMRLSACMIFGIALIHYSFTLSVNESAHHMKCYYASVTIAILSLPLYTQSIGCLPKLLADCTIEIGEAVFFADLTILRLFVIFAYL